MFAELESLRDATTDEDKARRKDLTDQVTIELVRHSPAREARRDELRSLGTQVEAFKKVAPTHPHPHVPNTAMAPTAAGPAASLWDRMRDLATDRGTE